MTLAYIGLGSNLGDPGRQVSGAVSALAGIPGTSVIRRSSLYRSRPYGVLEQPDFINAAVMVDTTLGPRELLRQLLRIEDEQGRDRDVPRWGPRILDLDLLVYGGEQIREADLTVPHPQISKRNFVLMPLVELSRDLEIPGMGLARDLLDRAGYSDIEPLPDDDAPLS